MARRTLGAPHPFDVALAEVDVRRGGQRPVSDQWDDTVRTKVLDARRAGASFPVIAEALTKIGHKCEWAAVRRFCKVNGVP